MKIKAIIPLAQKLFLHPTDYCEYNAIISGAKICGKSQLQKAVGQNTFRGFHRKAGFKRGASAVFEPFFIKNKTRILKELRKISTRAEMDGFSDVLREEIKKQLTNVKDRQLESYNKIRKPVDLYIEHIVAMASELSPEDRARLVPALFLPLDSWIFGSSQVFSESELKVHGLSRRSTYKDISDRDIYVALHTLIQKRAQSISPHFHPIYFDLIWGDRHLRANAKNLFESNP